MVRARAKDQGHIKLLGEHRTGESFVVACHEYVDFLSHGTVLEGCTIEIRGSGRNVLFGGAVLRDCTVVAARPLTNYRWYDVTLEGCTFLGRYKGCDFGPRPDLYPDEPPGRVDGCDFSGAVMHLCRLFRCELDTTRLPRWPRFSLVDPLRHAAE